jgi:lipopolysaccharide transport system ATP-binding protein
MVCAVRVEGLGKRYEINKAPTDAHYGYRSLREDLMDLVRKPIARWTGRARAQRSDFWALQDVSFELPAGEVLAILGRNGAGKSTLMKILSRITRPTTGRAELHGRVGSLLEVGTGFHPELTGRENIFLNGAVLGMTRREIARKFDEIVAFAEVEQFLDTPVKRYSSGMYVRLAFAVAAHLEPEILIVDEVLAVGDAEFQRKCLNKMKHEALQGRTVLFVSHNMTTVRTLCRKALLLSQGRVIQHGPAEEVIVEYLRTSDLLSSVPLADRTDRRGAGRFRFEKIAFLDESQCERGFAITGEDLYIRLHLKTPEDALELTVPLDVAIRFRDYQGQMITTAATFFTGESPSRLGSTRTLVCRIPRLPLLSGHYRVDLWCATSLQTHDKLQDVAILRVDQGKYFAASADARPGNARKHGCCLIPQEWYVEDTVSAKG